MSNTKAILYSWGMNKSNASLYKERLLELNAYFKTLDLKLCKDSQLIKNYVNGTGTHTLEEIGNIMIEMKFFYEKTNYRGRLKENRSKFLGNKFLDDFDEDDDYYFECSNTTPDEDDDYYFECPNTTPDEEELLRKQTKHEVLLEYLQVHPSDDLPLSLRVPQ